MKKLNIIGSIILFAMLLNSSLGNAQIDLGLKAGANFATISDASSNGSKTGFVTGVFAGGKLGEKWAIQGELLYSQQGSKFDVFNFDLDYLNIPIIFKRYAILGFNVQGGAQFGFLINDNFSEISEAVQDNLESKNFDLSLSVGLGYDFIFGIRFDARYQFGMLDVTSASGYSGQNRVFTLTAGYSFL